MSVDPELLKIATPANLASSLSGGKWTRAPHLTMLSQLIVEAAMGRRKRILISLPPRHGKSELISKWTPLWYLNLLPQNRVILASYAHDFAETWGRAVRNLAIEHADTLRFRIAPDSSAASKWYTTAGGGMFTTGVGGPLTGLGADLFLIDDPTKNMEDASSETLREKQWEWFTSTAYTRLEPGAAMIVLATRWNEDDLIGRLERSEAEEWTVINIPAIAGEDDPLGRQPGEALWPERYPLEVLRVIEAQDPYTFGALYQGDPRPRSGGIFGRGMFEFVDGVPFNGRWVRFWDLAGTDAHKKRGSDPDYTVGALLGKAGPLYYLADIVRFRAEPATVEQRMLATARRDGKQVKIVIEQEPGSAGKFAIKSFTHGILADYNTQAFVSTGSKMSYADVASSRAQAGRIKLLRAPAWNDAFIRECEAFPRAPHDDQVDAMSKAIAYFERKAAWGVVPDKESA